jgi:hypothetical protein
VGSVGAAMSTTYATTIASGRPFCESRRMMGGLEDDLTNDDAMAATHDQRERLRAEKGRELLWQMMQFQH